MKSYTVYFSEPVCYKFIDNKSNKKVEKWDDTFTFYSLIPAKKLIKANLDKYKSSCIIKYEQMGIGKNLGEIDIKKIK
jgi:hypothetical protein